MTRLGIGRQYLDFLIDSNEYMHLAAKLVILISEHELYRKEFILILTFKLFTFAVELSYFEHSFTQKLLVNSIFDK